jgi:prepilin-type N-terminal cleavage/methylation domain-containing protein
MNHAPRHVAGDKLPPRATRHASRAFTLVELLAVITIIGILAGLSVPALKNLGKSNIQIGAARQLQDDIGRARQLAISQRTTIYMVFVPTNFWNGMTYSAALTNLVAKQLTGYNFVSYGKVGDQPGQHYWHYLSDWQTLPDGSFIAAPKFQPATYSMTIPFWSQSPSPYAGQIDNWRTQPQINGFVLYNVPFPTETSPVVAMPCLIFDYQGRLVSEVDGNGNYHHAYIPLAQGTVSYGMDLNKQPTLRQLGTADITEIPAGNSSSISYNVIDVNPLTGRATLQKFQMQ